MKLITHNIFSIGLVLYVASYLTYLSVFTVILAVPATILTNFLIDKVGHDGAGGVPRRTWVTHSVVTAPLWGGLAWALTLIVPAALFGVFPPNLSRLGFFLALGVLSGWSHLFLDSLTEGGVYGFDRRRRALGHLPYDNRAMNLGCSALGFTLFFVALMS